MRKVFWILGIGVLSIWVPVISWGELKGEEPAVDVAQREEAEILSLVLRHSHEDGGFTVVSSKTGLGILGLEIKTQSEQVKIYINKKLKLPERKLSFLLDEFFEKNKISIITPIKSDPANGYLVDSDNKFRQYLESNGGGWERWYQENPKAHGYTTVSRPVLDVGTGMVLLYAGTQHHYLNGAGFVILCRYEKGGLTIIDQVMVWVS